MMMMTMMVVTIKVGVTVAKMSLAKLVDSVSGISVVCTVSIWIPLDHPLAEFPLYHQLLLPGCQMILPQLMAFQQQ